MKMMKKEMSRKERGKKAQEVKDLISGIVNETIHIPDNAIIGDADVLIEIFTKKRIELIRYINQFNPDSVQKLANLTHRKKQAVDRDLKILERSEILTMDKIGRKVIPKIERKVLIMELTHMYPSEKSINEAKNQKEILVEI